MPVPYLASGDYQPHDSLSARLVGSRALCWWASLLLFACLAFLKGPLEALLLSLHLTLLLSSGICGFQTGRRLPCKVNRGDLWSASAHRPSTQSAVGAPNSILARFDNICKTILNSQRKISPELASRATWCESVKLSDQVEKAELDKEGNPDHVQAVIILLNKDLYEGCSRKGALPCRRAGYEPLSDLGRLQPFRISIQVSRPCGVLRCCIIRLLTLYGPVRLLILLFPSRRFAFAWLRKLLHLMTRSPELISLCTPLQTSMLPWLIPPSVTPLGVILPSFLQSMRRPRQGTQELESFCRVEAVEGPLTMAGVINPYQSSYVSTHRPDTIQAHYKALKPSI